MEKVWKKNKLKEIELQKFKVQLQYLLDRDFIQFSVSPYEVLVSCVQKKIKSLRMCINYKALN